MYLLGRACMSFLIYQIEPHIFYLLPQIHFPSLSARRTHLYGLHQQGFSLVSTSGEIGRNREREIRVFILLAELHVRSPVLIKDCPSLNDDLFYRILAPYWFQRDFSPIVSFIFGVVIMLLLLVLESLNTP